jgi:hypothetical protein
VYEDVLPATYMMHKWDVDDDLRELVGRLADVTGDDTYG